MRDKETIEIAMEAAETGHLNLLSTLHTIDASKRRSSGLWEFSRWPSSIPCGNRLAKRALRYIISQRLVPRKDGGGLVAAVEILKATLRTREYVEKGEVDSKTLLDAMRVGEQEGMQTFDGDIERRSVKGTIDMDTGLASRPTQELLPVGYVGV